MDTSYACGKGCYCAKRENLQMRKELIKALVEAGADIALKNKDGQTALMIAQSTGQYYGDMFAKLLQEISGKHDAFCKKIYTAD